MKNTIQIIVCFALAYLTAALVRRYFAPPLKNEPWRADWRARQVEYQGKRMLAFYPTACLTFLAYLVIWSLLESLLRDSN
jgi:hypothetical protein